MKNLSNTNYKIIFLTTLTSIFILGLSYIIYQNIFNKIILVKSDNESHSKVEYVSDKHTLAFCAEGNTPNEAEEYFASTSEAVSGYKLFVDCNHAINSYYPDRKSEYFGIQHISTGVGVGKDRAGGKYYIEDNEKYIVGTPKILGVLNNYIFINYCYEGCGRLKMLDLKLISPDGSIQSYELGSFLDLNKVYSSDLFVLNNKVIIVYQNKIYELNPSNLNLKTIKEIKSGEMFGTDSEAGYGFSPDCKVYTNILRCNIYSLKETQDSLGRKPIDKISIEIK